MAIRFEIQVPFLALLFLVACFIALSDHGINAGVTSGFWNALKTFNCGGLNLPTIICIQILMQY